MFGSKITRVVTIVLIGLVAVVGVVFAIEQITRVVSASVNVQLLTDSGIEIYLDSDLTEIADSVDFGVLEVDVFGTVKDAAAVPVWVENRSLSRIKVTLRDDFAPADVLFVGPNQQQFLDPGEVLAGVLTLKFHEVSEGIQAFTVFVDAEGPFELPSGNLAIAVLSVNAPNGLPRFCTAGCAETIYVSGLTETSFNSVELSDGTIAAEPMLALDFALDPSLEFADFTLRQGVQFHDGWGEMTAEDVAFSYNDANSVTNPESIHGQAGDFAPLILSMEAIEPHIVRLNYRNFDSRGVLHRFSRFWQTAGIVSKDVFDSLGPDAMESTLVGVGAYEVDEWTQNNGIFLNAFLDYYARGEGNIGPHVKNISWIEVPEGASRRAMLETEEVQIAQVATKDIPFLTGLGFETQKRGKFNTIRDISLVGNYWEAFSALSGDPLVRDRDTSLPWIGDPFEDGAEFDPNTASMVSSRKVRNAMAMAIDREAMHQDLIAGLGSVNNQAFLSQNDPNYDPAWDWGLDIAAAQTLMGEAGQGSGFDMDLWVGTSELGSAIGEAVSAGWQENLNINANLIKTAYSTYRPGLVARFNKTPGVNICGDENKSNFPFDWAHGFVLSSASAGGYGVGQEIPYASQSYFAMVGEFDKATREALADNFYTQNRFFANCVGIFEEPLWPMYNTDLIEQWDMRPTANGNLGTINNVRTIKLR